MGDAAAEVERTEDVHMMADDDMDGCPAAIEKLQSVGIGYADDKALFSPGSFPNPLMSPASTIDDELTVSLFYLSFHSQNA